MAIPLTLFTTSGPLRRALSRNDPGPKQVVIYDRDPAEDFNGYMWYTKAEPVGAHNVEVHFASGNGGNKIYIVPSPPVVVAITSGAYGQSHGQRCSQDIVLKILAAKLK